MSPLNTLQALDKQQFYASIDTTLMVDLLRNEISYLKSNWKCMGRPVLNIYISSSFLGKGKKVASARTNTAQGFGFIVRYTLQLQQTAVVGVRNIRSRWN